MKKMILYVAGGLSNRVFPICSCLSYCEKTNRKLFIHWTIDNRCRGEFNELYENKLNFVNTDFLDNLKDNETEYHTRFLDSVTNDHSIYGRDFLIDKYNKGLMRIGAYIDLDKRSENIFLTSNTFLRTISEVENKKILKELSIKKEIKEKIDLLSVQLKLNKEIIGVHVRGTDFNNRDISNYVNAMRIILLENKNKKFFVCSDDAELEKSLFDLFPNNIIVRSNKIFVEKNNKRQSWYNNTDTTTESLKDSIIDLYLLAKTDFKIYNNNSTFSRYALILSEGN